MTPSPDLTPSSFLAGLFVFFNVSWDKTKSSKGNVCGGGGETHTHQMAEAPKGIQVNEFKNCFEQWKKVLLQVLHQMESTGKVTEV